ncbi:MAG: hypothetical protein GF350_12795 [Chitinivibrionales bacterium]|nr:hypothetical protein [Chitinivibrionales bacterium]
MAPVQLPYIRLTVLLLFLITVFCTAPTDTEKDLLEMERVWQYCKIYSIWQEYISDNPIETYNAPHEIVRGLPDTLYSDTVRYSIYWYDGTVPPSLFGGSGFNASTAQTFGPTVHYAQLTDSTLYIRILEFSEYTDGSGTTQSTYTELRGISSQSPNVIVDLRNNGGGNIDICTLSIDLFVPASTPYIGAMYRRNPNEVGDTGWEYDTLSTAWTASKDGGLFEGKSLVVLTDCYTASAAEIFAAGLRDGVPGTLIYGNTTFGKGIGQYVFGLASGGAIKITGFRFERASGPPEFRQYNKKGIAPDIPMQTVVRRSGLFWVDSLILTAGEALESGFKNIYDRAALSEIVRQNGAVSATCPAKRAIKFLRPEDLPVY